MQIYPVFIPKSLTSENTLVVVAVPGYMVRIFLIVCIDFYNVIIVTLLKSATAVRKMLTTLFSHFRNLSPLNRVGIYYQLEPPVVEWGCHCVHG